MSACGVVAQSRLYGSARAATTFVSQTLRTLCVSALCIVCSQKLPVLDAAAKPHLSLKVASYLVHGAVVADTFELTPANFYVQSTLADGSTRKDRAAVTDSSARVAFTVAVPVSQVGDVTITPVHDAAFSNNGHVFFYPPSTTVAISKGKCVGAVAAFVAQPAVYVSGRITPEVRSR